MRIAIHPRPDSYSDQWIHYCEENKIDFKLVNCYDSDILEQLSDCDGLLWHWVQWDEKGIQFARQLIYSLEEKGLKVYPDRNTCWHFDDKVGQKYLLESLNAPLVNSYAFYDKNTALEWVATAEFPKVFKLRSGASSLNVHLVRNQKQARRRIKRSFGKGYSFYGPLSIIRENFWKFQRDRNLISFYGVLKGLSRIILKKRREKFLPKHIGYAYFQDFIPGNEFDIRVVIIGDRCLAHKRYCRPNDFRASGSGVKEYDPDQLDKNLVQLSFEINDKLKMQSVAMDYIYDSSGQPFIVEISYAWYKGVNNCLGYWNREGIWKSQEIISERFIIEDFINEIDK